MVTEQKKILAFSGSSRKGSFNRLALGLTIEGARSAGATVTEIDLREFQLPIYDADLEETSGLPRAATQLKDLFLSHAGLLIACPEYNSAVTPLLKNSIDWVSRPSPGESALACYQGKVAALISASPGALGGMRALMEFRNILCNIQVLVLPNPVSVQKAHEAFDPTGKAKDAKIGASLKKVGSDLTSFLQSRA